jgi:hypothetical protein
MRRLLLILAALALIAATPDEVVPDLEASGFYVEEGAGASRDVVSDAVFGGRAAGGRLYIVVLADEPPGGATTFADSVLDRLGEGYVLVVTRETVGYAGDDTFWTSSEMNQAVDAALEGSSDDQVVQLFIDRLTDSTPAPEPSSSGGRVLVWLVVLIGGGSLFFWWLSRRTRERASSSLVPVKELARAKLAEVANDIIDLEDEVRLSDDVEVKRYYQRASETYSRAMGEVETATTAQDLVAVSSDLDEAIWELDTVEALLDGKPLPPKPEPPAAVPGAAVDEKTPPAPTTPYQRRPQRQASSGSADLLAMLMAIVASQRSDRGWTGGSTPGWPSGGSGGGRIGGSGGPPTPGPRPGGMRRIRGGGRRRG